MEVKMYREKFKVDNILYEFIADNSITFRILRGTSKKGIYQRINKYGFYDDDNEFDDLNICLSPFKVIEKVIELTLKYIRKERPYCFSFYGTSKRKGRIYVKLTKKILKKNPDIVNKYFFMESDCGYDFFKKN